MRALLLGVVAMACGFAANARADAPDMLPFAIMGGVPSVDVRLRAEHVDNDSATQLLDSNATTLRARLGLTTGKWNDLDLGFEYEGVTAWENSEYNSTTNGQAVRPVVGDPVGSELNQAWVRYAGPLKTTLQVGRMRLALDNQRFVGNAGWRQNEQTFDGATIVSKALPGTEVTYAYFHNVDSVFFTNFPMRTHLANISYAPSAWLKASVYSYWLDFDAANTGARQDGKTQGVRVVGSPALNAEETIKLLYAAEYAKQSHYGESAAAVDDKYMLAELGAGFAAAQLKAGYEVLGSSDGTYAVQTPLATMHAHDGWADMFLTTPAKGLRRTYAQLSGTVAGATPTLVYHRFDADFGGGDYGQEYDASIAYGFNRQLAGLVKYARYDATSSPAASFAGNVDTEKGWLQLEYKF